jgi:diguanylate cyclase (GGDEF)-like protein
MIENRKTRLRFWLGYAVAAAIAIGSIAIALVVHHREARSFERAQHEEALRASHQAEATAALSVGQLASAAAFYQATENLTQHKFDLMANSLLNRGALLATAFVQAVPRSRRAQFEREHGYPIVERVALGFRRAASRAEYYPLRLAASNAHLVNPYGYDLGSDPLRSMTLNRARITGRPTASPVMHLAIGGAGINVFRPVYRDGLPHRTMAQRKAALTGFAVGAFRLPNLAAAATSALPEDVAVELVQDGRSVLGPSLSPDGSAGAELQVADRTWLLRVRDPNRPDLSLPLLIAVFGIAMAALLGALVLIWSRNEKIQALERQASHDPLTGLKNRRRFEEDLRGEIARSRREVTRGALLMLDLDNFKQVNDSFGHEAGNAVLRETAKRCSAHIRSTDLAGRYGGDEFVVVLVGTGVDGALGVAEKVRGSIEEVGVGMGYPAGLVTASIGVAEYRGGGSDKETKDEDVLVAADRALYRAKAAGRNQVATAGDGGGEETA